MKHDETKLRVAIAKLDGVVKCTHDDTGAVWFERDGVQITELPDYLNSHDALAPVLATITDLDEQESVMERVLESVIERSVGVMVNSGWAIATAPARDWCEALVPLLEQRGFWV